jgi:prepilin-type N-terminal cleavage/methylation domain-containing protein
MALMCSFFMALAVLHLDCFDSKQARAQILSKFWHQPCMLKTLEGLMFHLKAFEAIADQELKASPKTHFDIGVETSVSRLHPERQEPQANGAIGNQKVQYCRGFSVLELVIGVMIIGLVASILIPRITGVTQAATTIKCAANLLSFAEEVELIWLDSPAPSQAGLEKKDIGWPNGKWKDYWYVPNNKDFNSGHGNDLDGCDEENPGKSTPNRDCIPMRFLIVCNHQSHGDQGDAKYLFITDMYPPQIVPFEEYRHTYLLDAKWWPKEDPGFDDWIGQTPKQ